MALLQYVISLVFLCHTTNTHTLTSLGYTSQVANVFHVDPNMVGIEVGLLVGAPSFFQFISNAALGYLSIFISWFNHSLSL